MTEHASYPMSETDIAIVGMAGRFPGARSIDDLWALVRDGLVAMTPRTAEEVIALGVPADLVHDPSYVKVTGTLEDVEAFDARFFEVGPRDAAIMDPQHRHFLECAWEALEQAGHTPDTFAGSIGVFAGCGMNEYLLNNLLTNPELVNAVSMFLLRHTANDKDFLTTHVSYKLNLRGPSVNVQTACSTSLVAMHLAVQALLNGECDMALAGGVTIQVPHGAGYIYREGEPLSPDGRCRAFDALSKGTVLTSGVGVVALRRLQDALADGDYIHAVIKGSAINNDGSGKVGYLAPSVDGHARVAAEALAIADVAPESVQYIEAHGTGTAVGDPIEVAALTQAYGAGGAAPGSIRIGSTKPNIGHLDTAAGVASVIKTVEALKHKTLPPMANFSAPNPLIDFASTPFYVSGEAAPWETDGGPRRAGVSSLGVGGTNAHLILQEAPPRQDGGPSKPWHLLVLSAKSEAALDRATANLAAWLRRNPDANLADVAYTLQAGRSRMPYRRVVAVRDLEDAIAALESKDPKRVFSAQGSGDEPSVVFMFPGGGAQYPNMGRGLYETEPVYRQEVDRCLALLHPELSSEVRSLMFPGAGEEAAAAERLQMPSMQLPAIFITEYALAKLLMSWGIKPAAMTGHSLGEYTAACIAGVFSLRDALEIVHLRGVLVEKVGDAAVLSVPLSEDELRKLLPDDVSLAVVNGPEMCAVSGPIPAIGAFEQKLKARGVEARRLKLNAAAHCYLLDPVLEEFGARLARVQLKAPAMPYVSNVTGTWVRAEDATDPAYWVRHLRHTVRFADGLATLLSEPDRLLIEVGPGTTLSSLARQQSGRPRASLSALPHPQEPVSAAQHLLGAVGRAWMAGLTLDWKLLHGGARPKLPLPTYPFERTKFWIEPGKGATAGGDALVRSEDMSEWFSRPVWKRADLLEWPRDGSPRWLIFLDDTGLGRRLVARLHGQTIVTVTAGEAFASLGNEAYVVNPDRPEDYAELFARLQAERRLPQEIVYLWSLRPATGSRGAIDRAMAAQRWGFFGLMWLAQAMGQHELEDVVRLTVVTNGMHGVDGEAVVHPELATVLGPVRVIPREISKVVCRNVDVEALSTKTRTKDLETLATMLAEELKARPAEPVTAYRAGKRWVQDHDPVPLPVAGSVARLREGGVYLITGGLGGLGLTLAEHLAANYRAKLVLQGRSGLPEREAWAHWLQTYGEHDVTSVRIRAVQRMEASGGVVLPVKADVTNLADMRALLAEAIERFGRLDGVFHAAGVIDDGLIQLKTRASAAAVLAPKVTGTLVLDEVLRGMPLDFVVLFSSTSAYLGLEGQVDYTAANAFLNAYAESRRGAGGPPVIAVNWGVWRAVGRAAQMLEGKTSAHAAMGAEVHPLLGIAAAQPDGRLDFTVTLDVAGTWVLDEHRLGTGTALIPGTGYLEMVRAAAEHVALPGTVELRDVFFLAPLDVADGARKAVRVALSPAGNGYAFVVSSNPAGADATAGWHDHVVGELQPVQLPAPEPRDVSAIAARCPRDEVTFGPGEQFLRQEQYLRFGPRWKVLRRMSFGEGEAIATLELQEQFHADLDVFKLHPALLDIATGFALPLLAGYSTTDAMFVPLSYKRVRIHAPLTARVVSHARMRAEQQSSAEVVAYDVTIMDEHGAVLVEVEEFSMRRVKPGGLTLAVPNATGTARLAEPSATGHAVASRPRPPIGYHAGILPGEGMEALTRILATGGLSQVTVSPIELKALGKAIDERARRVNQAATAKVARPDVGADYAAPSDPVESMLVEAWGDLLGVENIGVNDDFFDLGGHSLIAVRLFNRVKKAYGVELGLAVLFEAPTIAKLAAIIRAEAGITPEAPDAVAPAAETAARPARSSWSALVPIQTEGNGTPLFCVHGMNGNVLNFRDLAVRLGKDRPFYGLQAVGLNGVDKPHETIEEMASHYIEEMRRVQPRGPYLIAGYSGGGLVAFEMAHQLRAAGEEVALLAMLDTFAPTFLHKTSLDRVWWFLRGVRANGAPFVVRWLRVKARRRFLRLVRGAADMPLAREQLPADSQTVDLGDAFVAAQNRYILRPLADVPVDMFRATLRAEDGYVPRDMGWGPYALGGVRVWEVPGGHESMCLEPNVHVLSAHLRQAIERATRTERVGVA